MHYYNEFDPAAADWIENLIADGQIPKGEVDRRSIKDVEPSDVEGFTQCHFFAGVAGWSYALEQAGWPEDVPVWTGSCPCQPFSAAGKRKGEKDERHVWPDFYRLIEKCRPSAIFGEQVSQVLGFEWLAGVQADLEKAGFAVGACDLAAASIGAPHIRQRLYWLAYADSPQRRGVCPLRHRESNAGWRRSSFYVRTRPISTGIGGARRIEPGLAPVVDGVSNRALKVRAYGNAIIPPACRNVRPVFYGSDSRPP